MAPNTEGVSACLWLRACCLWTGRKEKEKWSQRGYWGREAQLCSHLQEGAVPEAAPDVQHSRAVKAVERAAEHHAVGSAPGAVLRTRTGRALSCLAPPRQAAQGPATLTNVVTQTQSAQSLPSILLGNPPFTPALQYLLFSFPDFKLSSSKKFFQTNPVA